MALLPIFAPYALSSDRLNVVSYALAGSKVDRSGVDDASAALSGAIEDANSRVQKGDPTCVYVPAGTYRIASPLPAFLGPGCIEGDGSSQSIIYVDPKFIGNLFSWSEAWVVTRPGPRIVGLGIRGERSAHNSQNAFVFFDRNDEVFMDDVEVTNLHGRALYSGATSKVPEAYMRESHMRSLRFFGDGAPGVPVVEFSSEGSGQTDATNELRLSQVDIYAPQGPGLVIRNNGTGSVRNITIESLRVEGAENGKVAADLLTIGDAVMRGSVNNIRFSNLELIDPYPGYAAMHILAAPNGSAPYQIAAEGFIGGGLPLGVGLRIDAGRTSTFRLSGLHTLDTNVVVGKGVSGIELDGSGQEATWTYRVDSSSSNSIVVPARRTGIP